MNIPIGAIVKLRADITNDSNMIVVDIKVTCDGIGDDVYGIDLLCTWFEGSYAQGFHQVWAWLSESSVIEVNPGIAVDTSRPLDPPKRYGS